MIPLRTLGDNWSFSIRHIKSKSLSSEYMLSLTKLDASTLFSCIKSFISNYWSRSSLFKFSLLTKESYSSFMGNYLSGLGYDDFLNNCLWETLDFNIFEEEGLLQCAFNYWIVNLFEFIAKTSFIYFSLASNYICIFEIVLWLLLM